MPSKWAATVGELLEERLRSKEKVGITMRGITEPYWGTPVEVDVFEGYVVIRDPNAAHGSMEASMLRMEDITAVNYVMTREERAQEEEEAPLPRPTRESVLHHLAHLSGVDAVFVRWTAALYGIEWPLPKRGS